MTTAWNWINSLLGRSQAKPAAANKRRKPARFVPGVMALEDRATPAVSVTGGFEGIGQGTAGTGGSPPDTDSAVGPTAIFETVNNTAILYNKGGGVLSAIDLNTMFPPSTANGSLFDPNVSYDDNSQRFFLVVMEIDDVNFTSFMHIAVSNTSTPTDFNTDFTEKQTIDMIQVNPTGTLLWADFPRIGYNADGIFVTTNEFDFITGANPRSLLTTFRKSTLLDSNPATLRFFPTNLTQADFTLVPVAMHQAPDGAPMQFVGTIGVGTGPGASSTQIVVIRMTNYFTITPTLVRTPINVQNFNNGFTPNAFQPFTAVLPNRLKTNDTAILDAGWRDGHLAATGNANLNGQAKVRWYEIDSPATGQAPRLIQQGTIDPGLGIAAFLPAIDIAQNLDIAMTYMQTSPNEFLSVYVTGRAAGDPKGTMQPPVRVRAGEAILNAPSRRTGDYGGIGVDPLRPNTFVISNEYATSQAITDNWGTWISTFNVSPLLPNPIKGFNPLRWTYDRVTDTYNGTLTLLNTTSTITGNLTLTLTVPDASVQVITPVGTRVGNTVTVPISGPFVQNVPLRIAIKITNPKKFALGSIQIGVITSIS